MYKPELKVDNKPLGELQVQIWIIKVGDMLAFGLQANAVVKNTEMMAMKYALKICKTHGLPLWICVENRIVSSTITIK